MENIYIDIYIDTYIAPYLFQNTKRHKREKLVTTSKNSIYQMKLLRNILA